MNTTLTAICNTPSTDQVTTPRRANARLAPGGREGPRERDTWVARTPPAGEAARWQLILDLLDPDKRCGAWSPATVLGRPVVCTRAPTTRARSTPMPKPGGAGPTKRPHAIPDGSPRTQHAQASAARPATRRRRDSPAGRPPTGISGRKESHHMTTIVTQHRRAVGRALRHDDRHRRRANQLRTGRWCPMAAMRPGRDSRWDVASNHCGAAGRAPAPGGGPEGGRR